MDVYAPSSNEATNIVRSIGDKLYGIKSRTSGECSLLEIPSDLTTNTTEQMPLSEQPSIAQMPLSELHF